MMIGVKPAGRITFMVIAGIALWAVTAAPAQETINNVIVNGDFESGSNWGGTTTPPLGWLQLDGSASPYRDPEVGPISGARSLRTEGDGGTRGQLTTQDVSMGPRWRFQADFAYEDPFVGRDNIPTSFQIHHPDSGSTNAGQIIVWVMDIEPDDGVAELWLRDVDVGGAKVNQGNIPGLTFSTDITNSPIVHELIIDGFYDAADPYYDIVFHLNAGGSVAFTNLQAWSSGKPVQGDSPDQLRLWGDSFSTGQGKWDNVRMGDVVTTVVVESTTNEFSTVAELSFTAEAGFAYRLQSTSDLAAQPFADENVQFIGSAAETVRFFDPDGVPSYKAYRVVGKSQ